MKLNAMIGLVGIIAALGLSGGNLFAQNDNGGGPGGPPPGNGGPGGPGGNFDPSEFRKRMMEDTQKNLEVTNAAEWGLIQPLVEKVMDARRQAEQMRRMGMGGPGGGPGGPGGPGGFRPEASEEQKALQKAINDGVPVAQIKEALAKYRAARQDKQAKLEAAQADLRSVLTLKQEAKAVLMGLLP